MATQARTIKLPSGTEADLAVPAEPVAGGLVIAPDLLGRRELYRELTHRLAIDQNWVVCTPEPFPGQETLTVDERHEAMTTKADGPVVADLVAAAAATGCDQVALLGFCMGGMYTLKALPTGRFVAHVPFYGMIRLPLRWRGDLGPAAAEPIDIVAASERAHRVLAIVGELDPYTPPADIEELRQTPAQVVSYPHAEHGFVHDPHRDAHRPADAADAWARALAFVTDGLLGAFA